MNHAPPSPIAAPQQRGAMSIEEFAEWAGIGKTRAREAVKEGRVRARRITKRRIIILPADADEFLNSLPVVGMAEAA